MADLQSDRFIRENISALETLRGVHRLSTEQYRHVTSLLEDWKSVESITFKTEPNYANCPLQPLLKEPTNRPGQDLPSVCPGNPPFPSPSPHAYSMQPQADQGNPPKKKTEQLATGSPQLPPRAHGVHQENTYPSVNRPLPPTPQIIEKRAPNPITPPSNSDEINRYLNREQEKAANTPCYVNTPSNPGSQPNSAEKKQLNPTEMQSRDWSYQNAENARLPTTVIPPIEVEGRPHFEPEPNMPTHRPGMVELNIFGEGNTIIHGNNEPTEYNNYPWGPLLDKEVVTHSKKSGTCPRERPQFPVPGDSNYLHTPGNNKNNTDKIKIERSSSIDVLATGDLRPQLPPRRKSVETAPQRQRVQYESKPGDPEYTNWKETYSPNPPPMGKAVPFFDGIERDPVAQDEYDEVDNLQNENEPLKTSDDYIMVFSSLEEKPAQDNRLAVFNLRELISEKTELQTDQQGLKRRKVIIERTFTHEEIEFYDLISNCSIFYIYLSEHNVLIQEIFSLEQPIGKLLKEKLSAFYNIDFGKTIITRGPQIGLLEVNDRMNASLQKVENFFKKLTKGKNAIDPRLSFHQLNITNSHLICVSQTDSILDKNNFEAYLGNRETKLVKKFQRLFIPLIQGTVPLRKDEIKDLISYLIVIYRIKDWEMLIPETHKRDQELKSDIESSIGLLYKCSPEDVIPQVTKLVKDCKMRESIYFYVKINNKLEKKLSDAVLGVSSRNIHLISVAKNCEIDLAYMWGIGDLEAWRTTEKGISLKFIDGVSVLLSSPEQCEEVIHVVLKSAVEPKKYLFSQ